MENKKLVSKKILGRFMLSVSVRSGLEIPIYITPVDVEFEIFSNGELNYEYQSNIRELFNEKTSYAICHHINHHIDSFIDSVRKENDPMGLSLISPSCLRNLSRMDYNTKFEYSVKDTFNDITNTVSIECTVVPKNMCNVVMLDHTSDNVY